MWNRLVALTLLSTLALLAWSPSASAAPRWVDRAQTVPRYVFQGDVGLGIGRTAPPGPGPSIVGPGLNLEGAFGITDRVELGLRTGIRMTDEARALQADGYGRTLWTETFGTGGSTMANPEVRVRWTFYSGSIAEIGLDGRMFLPFESGTRIGAMVGVPFTFHLADFVRIDTGAFVPFVFRDNPFFALTVPAYFWFQTSERFFLGPMAALRYVDPGPGPGDSQLLLGLGLGYQVASAVDLKAWFLMPDVNQGGGIRSFGGGFGVSFRINE